MSRAHRVAVVTASLLLGILPAAMPAAEAGTCGVGGVSVDLGTGETLSAAYPFGTPDGRWILAQSPASATAQPVYSTAAHPAWATSPFANYINPTVGGGGGTVNLPAGTYRYTTTFATPQTGVSARNLTLSFIADDGVLFYLNGVFIGGFLPAPPGDATTFQQFRTVSVPTPPVQPGANTLEARVINYGGPTALILIGSVVVCG